MTDTHNLPASMIEAAARVLFEELKWEGREWEELVRDDDSPDLAHWRQLARAVLAAAFTECEVREEWRYAWIGTSRP